MNSIILIKTSNKYGKVKRFEGIENMRNTSIVDAYLSENDFKIYLHELEDDKYYTLISQNKITGTVAANYIFMKKYNQYLFVSTKNANKAGYFLQISFNLVDSVVRDYKRDKLVTQLTNSKDIRNYIKTHIRNQLSPKYIDADCIMELLMTE